MKILILTEKVNYFEYNIYKILYREDGVSLFQ